MPAGLDILPGITIRRHKYYIVFSSIASFIYESEVSYIIVVPLAFVFQDVRGSLI